MDDVFKFADELGPLKVIYVHEPSIGLKGILVVDNVATGPSIGGLRMAPDVSVEECFRLARAMTLKNAAAGLPHGGGKSVLFGDPKMPKAEKERLIRGFACALQSETQYIFGPDMGTDEECMAWVKAEIGRSVGLPPELGGIPLDELGATGWGVYHAAEVAQEFCDVRLEGARVAVQGFGSVGMHAARFLNENGAILVAAADSGGTLIHENGLDVQALIALKKSGKSVTCYEKGENAAADAIVDVPCDIWIPAARPDVIHADNVARLNTKLVIQGANIPITYEAEKVLHDRGVLCVPDFISNAGGEICAAMEYRGAGQMEAFDIIQEKLRTNTRQVLEIARAGNLLPRDAAVDMARQRLHNAMGYARWSLF